MKRTLTTLAARTLVLAATLAGCTGADALVGVNPAETGGGAGTGNDAEGTSGSHSVAGSSGSGSNGGTVAASTSVTHFVGQIRMGGPDLCMPRQLPVEASGAVNCRIYAAVGATTPVDGPGCACDEPGRAPIGDDVRSSVVAYLEGEGQCSDDASAGLPACEELCLCEALQAEGADLVACQNEPAPPSGTDGWCYVAPAQGVGVSALVAECDERMQQRVLFYGDGLPRGESFVLACADASVAPSQPAVARELGEPCLPADELSPAFAGYAATEVTVETDSAACESRVCLVNHLQGRVSCPYGQTEDQVGAEPACFVPGSSVAVTVPVEPQLLARQAANTAVCSCRCDGPGDGPFCACPSDMTCAPLVSPLGLPGEEALAGSYCIPNGTTYDPLDPSGFELCNADAENCGEPRPY